jgi:hypothetical protein
VLLGAGQITGGTGGVGRVGAYDYKGSQAILPKAFPAGTRGGMGVY